MIRTRSRRSAFLLAGALAVCAVFGFSDTRAVRGLFLKLTRLAGLRSSSAGPSGPTGSGSDSFAAPLHGSLAAPGSAVKTTANGVIYGMSVHNDTSPKLRDIRESSAPSRSDRVENENPSLPNDHVDEADPVVQS